MPDPFAQYAVSAPVDERGFQGWYADRAKRLNLNPNPDDPQHFYDYRAAFQAKAEPDATGHWPSQFKREGHPRMIVDGMNTKTGETADPFAAYAIAEPKPEAPKPPPSMGRQLGRAALDTLPGIGALVGGVLSTPETLGAGTVPGMALGAGAGKGLRDLIGHYTGLDVPSTPLEKAGGIAKETAIAGATGAILPGMVAAVKAPLQTLREGAEQFGSAMPPAIRRLGRLVMPPPSTGPGRILTRPAWQTWEGAAPSVATPEATATGTGFQGGAPLPTGPTQWRVNQPVSSAAAPEAPATRAMATGLSAEDRAALVKQGYRPDLIAQIEQRIGGASPGEQRIAPMPAHVPTQPELQGPRMMTGAEQVGRQVGMTKDAVREAAGPVLDEAQGAASPILPTNALGTIIDTLKAMPPGSAEREAYVARATSGKTKWQVENIRRTLEHLGLVLPAAMAAPAMRESLLQMMQSHSQPAEP